MVWFLLQNAHCIKTGCVLLIAHNCDDKEMKKYYNGYYQLFGYWHHPCVIIIK